MEEKILSEVKRKEYNGYITFNSLMNILKDFGYNYNQCWIIQNKMCDKEYLKAIHRYGKISAYKVKF